MIFADLLFLYLFIPLFGISMLLARLWGRRSESMAPQNLVLLAFSLLFYAWGEPVYILLLLFGVAVSFLTAKAGRPALGILYHIVVLCFFKYGNFFQAQLLQAGLLQGTVDIHLPMGISFYSFQCISYLADVLMGKQAPQKRFSRLLLYISMFPQLIAGPIVRYSDVSEELETRSADLSDMAEGVRRFVTGLGKKVLLADQLSLIAADTLGAPGGAATTGCAWLGLLAFSLQIYFDFSGYSDMAIGMGRCMGFHFPENFNLPYLCCSVTDFWRRWHMSLGTFFRDYVYIPLGGGRGSLIKVVRNVLLVWMLTGIWHGAGWNFLIWGLSFGLLLLLERALFPEEKDRRPKALPGRVLWRLLTLLFVMLGWGVFYFDDLGRLTEFFRILFFGRVEPGSLMVSSLFMQHGLLILAALLFCLPWKKLRISVHPLLQGLFSALILAAATVLLIGSSSHPFLYTRF